MSDRMQPKSARSDPAAGLILGATYVEEERCSGLMKPDTHLGENARHREVSDDQATSYLYP